MIFPVSKISARAKESIKTICINYAATSEESTKKDAIDDGAHQQVFIQRAAATI